MLRKTSVATAVLVALSSLTVQAEGYKLLEQSVSSMGNAYAGRGAQITDATLVYSNPAALTELKGEHLSGGLNLIHARTRYSDAQAVNARGLEVTGRDHGKVLLTEVVPFAFYSQQLNDDLSWGLGFYVPFGLSSNYQQDWVGRYFADETAVQIVSLQPALGYKLTDWLSVGGAISLNRAEGTLSKYKDHSGLCELGSGIAQLAGRDLSNAAFCDSHYEVTGSDVSLGYTLALHAEPLSGTRLALIYHSAVRYTLSGDSEITNTPITAATAGNTPGLISVAPGLPLVDASTGRFAARDLLTERSKLALTTPATLTFSLDQQLNAKFSVQGSVLWTGWSVFKSIDIVSKDANPSISLSTGAQLGGTGYIGYIPEYWHDTWSFSLGATYQYQADLTLRAGIAYDENPIHTVHKTARIPTSDRIWLTTGLTTRLSAQSTLDLAYGYMFMDDVAINEFEYGVADNRLNQANLQANYRNKAHVLGVQFNYQF
ncbi:outer membrane protein transport protein [Alishewanella sp. BS5-314]|uniref:OmpP1/FadL family transporter n=1 Tax=Alishewanella sp. BS5-314 TaxID=2755587 RepID=UPI0021BAEC50|nr:outer membrane protein transport protein [Alishewanella sp. BS5-314]MCT8126342.1 outer membrane protein transport protein [Alishewanella sp. BS5-314]